MLTAKSVNIAPTPLDHASSNALCIVQGSYRISCRHSNLAMP